MKFAYDLCGAEPIIKDEPIYDAATIQYGELVMLGTGAASAGAGSLNTFVTGVVDTVGGTMAVDALGICLETKTTADSPSIAAGHIAAGTAGGCFGKCIINPFAVYRAEVDTAGFAIASSTTPSQFTVTGSGQNLFNGSWVYFSASAGPNYGEIRQIVAAATSGTQVMDSVVANTITTADQVVVIAPKNGYSNVLNTTATGISQTSVGGYTATNLRVVETYINKQDGGFEIMSSKQKGSKVGSGLAGKVRFFNDIMMKDHIFGVQE